MRTARVLTVAAVLVGFLCATATAQGASIGFDDLPPGTRVAEQYASQGVHFGVSPFVGISGGFVAAVSDRGASAANAAALDYDSGTDFSSSWIRFDRQQAQVTLRACRVGAADPATNVNVRALDSNGTEVANLSGILCDPQGPLQAVTVTAQNITYLNVAGTGSGWQLDDLGFETDPAPQAPPVLPPTPPPPPPKNFTIRYETPLQPATIVLTPGSRVTRRIVLDRSESSFGPVRFRLTGGTPPGLAVNFTPTTLSGTGREVTTLSVSAEPDMAPAFLADRQIRAEPQGTTAGSVTRVIPIEILVQGQLAVHTEGIEISQAVQTYDQPTRDPYAGVALVARKTTVVRVFAGYSGTVPPAIRGYPRRPPLGMALTGVDGGGTPLPGSPLSPVWSPPADSLSVNDFGLSSTERNSSSSAFVFVLPPSWTNGRLALTARALSPAPSSPVAARLRPEPAAATVCLSFRCGADPVRGLGGITFRQPPPAKVISAVSLLYVNDGTVKGVPPTQRITGVPVDPGPAFEKLIALSPIPLLFLGADGGVSPVPSYRAVRFAPTGAILEATQAYDDESGRRGDYVLGLFAYPPGAGYAPGPRSGVADATAGTGGYPQRPLTTVAHEPLHLLGLGHADSSCGGLGGGFPTPEGRMSSVGIDTTWGSGGASPGDPPFRVIADALFGRGYDLMSYCQLSVGDPRHWISARNWNRLLGVAPAVGTERVRAAHAGPALTVRARTTVAGAEIVAVRPAGDPPAPLGETSAYTLVARDAAGAVVASVPMSQQSVEEDSPGGAVHLALEGAVPAPSVARLEVVLSGVVLASRVRSAAAPAVRIVAPRAGARVGAAGRPVDVVWEATDPDGDALAAAVEFSADGGRTWRQAAGGADLGRVRLPPGLLTPSPRARLRVRVDDGFTATTSSVLSIVVPSRPPAVTILSPRPRQAVQAGAAITLSGVATDDRGRRISGDRLRWFAGNRLLGRGSTISASLPAGTRTVRLRATDARGRQGDSAVPVRLRPTTPFFVRLEAPARIAPGAGSLVVTVSATQTAILGAGAQRVPVGTIARRVRLTVRPGRGKLVLRLSLSSGGRRSEQYLVVARG